MESKTQSRLKWASDKVFSGDGANQILTLLTEKDFRKLLASAFITYVPNLEKKYDELEQRLGKRHVEMREYNFFVEDTEEKFRVFDERIKTLENQLEEKENLEIAHTIEMSPEDCADLILKEMKTADKPVFPSDISFKYNLDYDFVYKVFLGMAKIGLIEFIDE